MHQTAGFPGQCGNAGHFGSSQVNSGPFVRPGSTRAIRIDPEFQLGTPIVQQDRTRKDPGRSEPEVIWVLGAIQVISGPFRTYRSDLN